VYSANGNGAGVAAAFAERVSASAAVTPMSVFSCQSGVAVSCLSPPLELGSSTDTVYVSLYATGIRGASTVQAFVAGQPATVQYAGAQGEYQGLDQVNVVIPQTLAGRGEVSVYLVADGKVSNMTTIKIQRFLLLSQVPTAPRMVPPVSCASRGSLSCTPSLVGFIDSEIEAFAVTALGQFR
jgi:uncharacterized protein (TIGR03437 family)